MFGCIILYISTIDRYEIPVFNFSAHAGRQSLFLFTEVLFHVCTSLKDWMSLPETDTLAAGVRFIHAFVVLEYCPIFYLTPVMYFVFQNKFPILDI